MAGGAEVGTGHISIFPVMNGFRNAVNKEMKNAGKTGSKPSTRPSEPARR